MKRTAAAWMMMVHCFCIRLVNTSSPATTRSTSLDSCRKKKQKCWVNAFNDNDAAAVFYSSLQKSNPIQKNTVLGRPLKGRLSGLTPPTPRLGHIHSIIPEDCSNHGIKISKRPSEHLCCSNIHIFNFVEGVVVHISNSKSAVHGIFTKRVSLGHKNSNETCSTWDTPTRLAKPFCPS